MVSVHYSTHIDTKLQLHIKSSLAFYLMIGKLAIA